MERERIEQIKGAKLQDPATQTAAQSAAGMRSGGFAKTGCTGLADNDAFFAECMDISYQFLHRAASACCKADIGNGTVPVLVYQLFFDAKDVHHIEKMEQFKADLRRWAETLKLRNMKFLIVSVPVTNAFDKAKMPDGLKKYLWNRYMESSSAKTL